MNLFYASQEPLALQTARKRESNLSPSLWTQSILLSATRTAMPETSGRMRSICIKRRRNISVLSLRKMCSTTTYVLHWRGRPSSGRNLHWVVVCACVEGGRLNFADDIEVGEGDMHKAKQRRRTCAACLKIIPSHLFFRIWGLCMRHPA